MSRKKTHDPYLDSVFDAKSSNCERYSSSSILSKRVRLVGNKIPYSKMAHDREQDCERSARCSHAHSIPAEICAPFASTDVFRSSVRSKLPTHVRDIEQPVCASGRARDRDRNSRTLKRRLRAPDNPMSNCTNQLLGRVRKLIFQRTRSCGFVLDCFKRTPQETYHRCEHKLRNIGENDKE